MFQRHRADGFFNKLLVLNSLKRAFAKTGQCKLSLAALETFRKRSYAKVSQGRGPPHGDVDNFVAVPFHAIQQAAHGLREFLSPDLRFCVGYYQIWRDAILELANVGRWQQLWAFCLGCKRSEAGNGAVDPSLAGTARKWLGGGGFEPQEICEAAGCQVIHFDAHECRDFCRRTPSKSVAKRRCPACGRPCRYRRSTLQRVTSLNPDHRCFHPALGC